MWDDSADINTDSTTTLIQRCSESAYTVSLIFLDRDLTVKHDFMPCVPQRQ